MIQKVRRIGGTFVRVVLLQNQWVYQVYFIKSLAESGKIESLQMQSLQMQISIIIQNKNLAESYLLL